MASHTQHNHFDVCVIGCGPAGFAGAMRAVDLGKTVCIVERKQIGGAGLMWGALASKTMWELAKDYFVATRTDRGYRAENLTVHYKSVRKTVFQAVREKQQQMLDQIKTFHPHRDRESGSGSVIYKRGAGAFVDSNKLSVTYADGTSEMISADYFLVATGSSPRVLPGVEVDQKQIFDSDGILKLKQFPKRIMIVGAGIVGCEYATIFSNYGQSRVLLLDRAQSIIPYEDTDVSTFVGDNLTRNGVEIYHKAILKTITPGSGHLNVTLELDGTRSLDVPVEAVLISVGREPKLDTLKLDRLGITPDKRGFLAVDENCCVRDNIYAAGDVTAHPALVNIAETEARYAVKHMYGAQKWPLRYRNMSTVMFFSPAVAAVGLNEKDCREKKLPYRVALYSNKLVSRALAMRAAHGFVKIIVSDDEEQRILGMRAAGPQVSNTIMSIAMIMDQGKGLRDVLKSVHPHPTMSEGIQECLRVLQNKSIYKPQAFPDLVQIHTWRPGE
jgi:dihydrolipoyl dehydrogenase